MKKTLLALSALSILTVTSAQAASVGIDPNSTYLGGGLSRNHVSGLDDATGWQLFGGMDFAKAGPVVFAGEVGYMDSGNFGGRSVCVPGLCVTAPDQKFTGLWATGVARLPVNRQFSVFGRAGLDFGDDDGLMVGVGAGYKVSPQVELRGEYVDRDHIGSLQFNVAFFLNAH